MSEITKTIGERIRIYRIKAGYTQETLAEKAGLHQTYIGYVERGEKNATLESVEKIVAALNISFETLFEKITTGEERNAIPAACFDLINGLTADEQTAIYELIKKTIAYRKL